DGRRPRRARRRRPRPPRLRPAPHRPGRGVPARRGAGARPGDGHRRQGRAVTSAIDLRGLSYSFGEHRPVDDLTLTVEPGECFGLLGPNGAGKTTTIRLLNTLLPLHDGDVWIFGNSVRTAAMDVRRLIGYVPQQLSIEGDLTGRENVEWFARLFD